MRPFSTTSGCSELTLLNYNGWTYQTVNFYPNYANGYYYKYEFQGKIENRFFFFFFLILKTIDMKTSDIFTSEKKPDYYVKNNVLGSFIQY